MKLSVFLYLIFNIIIVQLSGISSDIVTTVIYCLCALGVLSVGLSHGAVDDILHNKNLTINRGQFLAKYVSVILLYGLFWFVFPDLALLIFLLISGYHFGQAQFVRYKFDSKILRKVLYLSWGFLVISLLFCFHSEYLLSFGESYFQIPSSLFWIIENSTFMAIGLSICLLLIWTIYFLKKQIGKEDLLMELVILAAIFASSRLLDPFVAFSLFFVLIHSVEALNHELEFFKSHLNINDKMSFAKFLLPFTIISIISVAMILIASSYFQMTNYIPFIILVLISSVTVPHSFVMERFYTKHR